MENKSKTQIVAVRSFETSNAGELVIVLAKAVGVTKPTEALRIHPVQERRILTRAGIAHRAFLKPLANVANGTMKVSLTVTECNAGEAWDNGKPAGSPEYKTGTYDKNWTRVDVVDLDLGPIANAKIADKAMEAMFANIGAAPAPVAKQEAVVAPVGGNDDEQPAPQV